MGTCTSSVDNLGIIQRCLDQHKLSELNVWLSQTAVRETRVYSTLRRNGHFDMLRTWAKRNPYSFRSALQALPVDPDLRLSHYRDLEAEVIAPHALALLQSTVRDIERHPVHLDRWIEVVRLLLAWAPNTSFDPYMDDWWVGQPLTYPIVKVLIDAGAKVDPWLWVRHGTHPQVTAALQTGLFAWDTMVGFHMNQVPVVFAAAANGRLAFVRACLDHGFSASTRVAGVTAAEFASGFPTGQACAVFLLWPPEPDAEGHEGH